MHRAGVVALVVFAILVAVGVAAYGLWRSASAQPQFWSAFLPNLWATLIGVTVAAIVGIPIGFAINHYVTRLAEGRALQRQMIEVREALEQVKTELVGHPGILQQLRQMFAASRASAGQIQPMSLTITPVVTTLQLQEVFGRQFLSRQVSFDVGESLVSFQVGNYYARVWELNQLLTLRIQQTGQAEILDRLIASQTEIVSTRQPQVELEIRQAIERLNGRIRR